MVFADFHFSPFLVLFCSYSSSQGAALRAAIAAVTAAAVIAAEFESGGYPGRGRGCGLSECIHGVSHFLCLLCREISVFFSVERIFNNEKIWLQ